MDAVVVCCVPPNSEFVAGAGVVVVVDPNRLGLFSAGFVVDAPRLPKRPPPVVLDVVVAGLEKSPPRPPVVDAGVAPAGVFDVVVLPPRLPKSDGLLAAGVLLAPPVPKFEPNSDMVVVRVKVLGVCAACLSDLTSRPCPRPACCFLWSWERNADLALIRALNPGTAASTRRDCEC